jgi:hypothetical protein
MNGLRPKRKVGMKRYIKANSVIQVKRDDVIGRLFLILSEKMFNQRTLRIEILISAISSFARTGDSSVVNGLCELIWPTIIEKRDLPPQYRNSDVGELLKDEVGYSCYQYLLNEYLEALERIINDPFVKSLDDETIDSIKEEMLAICHVVENSQRMHRIVLKFFSDIEELGNKGVIMRREKQIFQKSLIDLPRSYLHKDGISVNRIRMYVKYLCERRAFLSEKAESRQLIDSLIKNLGISFIRTCPSQEVSDIVLSEK